MIKKIIKNRLVILAGVLSINILILIVLDIVESFLDISKPEIDDRDNILNNILFYSVYLIIIAPFLEEILYRLPLRRNSFTFFSLIVGVIYILIFDLLLIRIALGIYLVCIIYLMFLKNKIPKIFILISIFVFTISHIGNYNLIDVKSMNSLGLIFLLSPQLILGIIVTLFRTKFSFKYGLLYHALYNSIIILLALSFN